MKIEKAIESGIGRRDFLRGAACVAAAAAASGVSAGGESKPEKSGGNDGALISTAPVLQNAAETSIGVAFGLTAEASGWVEYSTRPDMSQCKRAYSGCGGMMELSSRLARVRLTGLKSATTYYYRIGADRIDYRGGYSMRNLGSECDGMVHSFTTLGAKAKGSFCVINDTHESAGALDAVFKKIAEIKPAAVIWNGDASNVSETFEKAKSIFITPHKAHPAYAADTPYMFINGNHDFRGRFNRNLDEVVMFREPAERDSEFYDLGRNFVQRLGDIALIGLDTGEDKLDTNRHFAGIFRMKEYRERQARWLEKAVASAAVKSAKFKVAFCHIPLFDDDPKANPGDIAPDDTAPQYAENYAVWQRTCAKLWGPSLRKAGVQLVIVGHQHCFRYFAPEGDRKWAQIVGGGPGGGKYYPTVIEGYVSGRQMIVKVHDAQHGRIVGEYAFKEG